RAFGHQSRARGRRRDLRRLDPLDVTGPRHHIQGMTASPGARQRWTLVATVLGSSMAFIDGTVVNLALPVLRESLGATSGDVQWVVAIYTLMLSALVLVGGALGDHFGRRRVFAIGIVVFAAASAACGLAQDPLHLIAARALQGLGAALLVPGSLALINA